MTDTTEQKSHQADRMSPALRLAISLSLGVLSGMALYAARMQYADIHGMQIAGTFEHFKSEWALVSTGLGAVVGAIVNNALKRLQP